MIKYTPAAERNFGLFQSPFGQALDANNRWVKMAAVVPWDEMATVFFSRMSKNQGRQSIDLRIVLGALLIKHIDFCRNAAGRSGGAALIHEKFAEK